jgi:hypothetical protein
MGVGLPPKSSRNIEELLEEFKKCIFLEEFEEVYPWVD